MAVQRSGAGTKSETPDEPKAPEAAAQEAVDAIPETDFAALLANLKASQGPQLGAADIAAIVQAEVAKALAGYTPAAPPQPIPVIPELPKYAKHYRNDLNPDIQIQELDMTALDRGERPQANPIPGSYIKFRLGHLYLQDKDENKIRQIEYMKSRPMYTMEGDTVGGNPAIYEDTGEVLYECRFCGPEAKFATKAAYDAHRAGLHGVVLNV